MEGVSTSRQAMEDSGVLGGQVWSPMEGWGGRGSQRESTRGERQLALGAASSPSSLRLCAGLSGESVCVCVCDTHTHRERESVCESSVNVRRREHSAAHVNPRQVILLYTHRAHQTAAHKPWGTFFIFSSAQSAGDQHRPCVNKTSCFFPFFLEWEYLHETVFFSPDVL